MSQTWEVEGPRVIDIGAEGERVEQVVVALVGGHVDVVTHDDSTAGRVEVASVSGAPLRVSWDGRSLKIVHGKEPDLPLLESLRRMVENFGNQQADVSISIPSRAKATVSTVSAEVVVSGLRRGLVASTVSGRMTLGDLDGGVLVNTVSGETECAGLRGDAKLNSVSGEITVQDADIPSAKINTVSGDVALDLRNGRVRVSSNSVSGDITVRAPFSGYAVTATTATGQVVVDGRSLHRTREGLPGGGTMREGDESLQVKANSLSGNLVVLRAGPPVADVRDSDGPQDAPVPSHPRAPIDDDSIALEEPHEDPLADVGEVPMDGPIEVPIEQAADRPWDRPSVEGSSDGSREARDEDGANR